MKINHRFSKAAQFRPYRQLFRTGARALQGAGRTGARLLNRAINSPAGQAAIVAGVTNAVNEVFTPQRQSEPQSFTSPGGTRREIKKRPFSASYGRHRGFVKGYRRMGRVTRKRYSKARTGMQVAVEQSGLVSDQKCVYIGHHSCPPEFVVKYAIYALVKRCLNTGDVYFSSSGEQYAGNITVGDQFGFEYRANPLAGTAAFAITVAAGDVSYADVMEKVWVQFKAQVLAPGTLPTNFGTQSSFTKFYWNSGGKNRVQLNLFDAKVSFMTKMSLKLQNRSINSVDDDESTDINNVPLHGKTYQFKGNTMIPRDSTAQDAATGVMNPCDTFYGYVAYGAGAVNAIQEPPESYFFMGNPKSRKVSLQPGDIKTSVITCKKTMNFSSFTRMVNGWYRGTTNVTRLYTNVGPSRFFAMERTISPISGEVIPAIQVAYEHESKLWVSVSCSNGNYTGPINLVL